MGLQIELLMKKMYLKNALFVSSSNINLTTIGLNANYERYKSPSKQANEKEKKLQGIIDSAKIVPKVGGLKDVAGLNEVKKQLQTVVVLPIFQPQLYSSFNISNCVLLFGPPGTGKTLLAHALAAEAKTTLYSISISDIVSSYVGESEKYVKNKRHSLLMIFFSNILERSNLFFNMSVRKTILRFCSSTKLTVCVGREMKLKTNTAEGW